MLVCYYVFKQLLCLFDGAKVRRFPRSHNPMCVAFAYHNYGISTKKASKMRNSTGNLANKKSLKRGFEDAHFSSETGVAPV